MTFVMVVRCDGPECSRTLDTPVLPADWIEMRGAGADDLHFCSKAHALAYLQDEAAIEGPTADEAVVVRGVATDEVPDEAPDASAATILNDIHARVLAWIRGYHAEKGALPFAQEVADALDISKSYAASILRHLRDDEMVTSLGRVTPKGEHALAARNGNLVGATEQ